MNIHIMTNKPKQCCTVKGYFTHITLQSLHDIPTPYFSFPRASGKLLFFLDLIGFLYVIIAYKGTLFMSFKCFFIIKWISGCFLVEGTLRDLSEL